MKKAESYTLVTTSVPMETERIKSELSALESLYVGRRTVFSGNIGNRTVRLIETGPGLVNTAQSLTAAIENRKPGMILMTGCAGGFSQAGLTIGDVAIATEENDTQLGIEPENAGEPLAALPFDLGTFNGVGVKHRIAVDPRIASPALDRIRAEFNGIPLKVLAGPFVTVSTITATDDRAGRLFNRFHPCMENMEGFAGAYIAKQYDIPFLEIRCASNVVGKRDRASWNLEIACERSAKAAVAWLRR